MSSAERAALAAVLRPVLRNAALRRAEAAWFGSIAAEWAYLVALLVYAYAEGGVLAVGVISTVRMLPAAAAAPFLTALSDRHAAGRVLAAVNLGRGLAIAIVAVAVAAGWPLFVPAAVAAAEGVLSVLNRPTMLSLLPALARSPQELIAANAITSTGEAVGVLAGPALAGLLLALGGPALGIALPAIAFSAAGASMLRVPTAHIGAVPAEGASRLRETFSGFGALLRYPSAGMVVGVLVAQVIVRGLLTVLLVAAAVDLLGVGEAGVGWLNSAIGAGGLIGSLIALALVVGRRLSVPFGVALAFWGIPIAVIGLAPHPAVAFACLGILGASNAVLDVSGFTLLQRCVPNPLRTRVFGALEAILALSVAAGALAAPLLVDLAGLRGALVIAGLLLPAVAMLSHPAIRRADAAAIVPARQLALLRGIPMFAPLPLTTLERLAASMVPLRLAAGEAAIRQGEPGDAYYLVESGTADVLRDGEPIAAVGPGDGFGEIALLSAVPRTATVTATDALTGFSLPRAAFLEAVTGSRHSARIADELVASRTGGAAAAAGRVGAE